ncbi:hypothetical protein [Corynebacterium sp. MSK218]|uniref:hypothetical protein n=1 Tax=Corynebacterium sp. MSK218 TaxID=3050218 RepID=UPI00254F3BA4|nr:hypothetical protein [Corynebacterium sp. MSK218]
MTFNFGQLPVGKDVCFVRTTIENVEQAFMEYPYAGTHHMTDDFQLGKKEWESLYVGESTVDDWCRLLLPQNFLHSVMFVDVDLPGWVAVVLCEPFPLGVDWGYKIADLDIRRSRSVGIPDDGVVGIQIGGWPGARRHRSLLGLDEADRLFVTVTGMVDKGYDPPPFGYYDDLTVARWTFEAWGMEKYEGLDSPVWRDMDREMKPPAITEEFKGRRERMFHYEVAGRSAPTSVFFDSDGNPTNGYGEEDSYYTKLLDEILARVPFDYRGHERFNEFFSTAHVARWLREGYGIRWDDPEFYSGKTLVYAAVEPEVSSLDAITSPRMPIEEFRALWKIDTDKVNDLISRGKF